VNCQRRPYNLANLLSAFSNANYLGWLADFSGSEHAHVF
jgi:hypothetical protein